MSFSYKVKLKVFDNTNTLVKDEVKVIVTEGFKTVGELKVLSNDGQYANIDTEVFNVAGIESTDSTILDTPHFLLHTIKLK
jgi:hypothetical protein